MVKKLDKKIKDVAQHHNGINIRIVKKDDLKKIIDEPCLQACEELFDKNIRTIDSGSSQECPDYAYVVIAYDSLNDENKILANKLIAEKKAVLEEMTEYNYIRVPENSLTIGFKTSPDDGVVDVSKKLSLMCGVFIGQEKMIKRDPTKIWEAQYKHTGLMPNPDFLPKEQQKIYRQWQKNFMVKR